MSAPAELIYPEATAVPMPNHHQSGNSAPAAPPTPLHNSRAATLANTKNDYFQPISFFQFLRRIVDVYLGHVDTFLTITVLVSLPVIVGYQWMLQGYWGSSTLFHYFLLPMGRLVADGATVTATAWIYLYQGQPVPWKIPFQTAVRKRLFSRWMLQVIRSSRIGFLVIPTGMLTFSSPLLLLQTNKASLIGCLFTSARLVFLHSIGTFVTTLIVTWGLAPTLSWILQRAVGDLVVGSVAGNTINVDEEGLDENDPFAFWSQRRQVQEVIALPLISCLWTILYINICTNKWRGGLTRESLAQEMGVQLPPAVVASVY